MSITEINFDIVIIITIVSTLVSATFNYIASKRQERAEQRDKASRKCQNCLQLNTIANKQSFNEEKMQQMMNEFETVKGIVLENEKKILLLQGSIKKGEN